VTRVEALCSRGRRNAGGGDRISDDELPRDQAKEPFTLARLNMCLVVKSIMDRAGSKR